MHARKRRATPIDSERWVTRLKSTGPVNEAHSERPDGIDADELQDWMREFGFDEDRSAGGTDDAE